MSSKHEAWPDGQESQRSRRAGEAVIAKANRAKALPVNSVDDFDFPAELQLPTFEDILETPDPLRATERQAPSGGGAVTAAASSAPPRAARVAAAQAEYIGVLFVGDLHLASRVPGFRKDDYPQAILGKLRWVLDYARAERLLPVLLGDVFDFPRDNANWLLVELHKMLDPQTPAIYGNHDCKENAPSDHDTVSILVASGLLRLLSEQQPWVGAINGCPVAIGGTCWGQKLPGRVDRQALLGEEACRSGAPAYVLWASHHDLRFPGFEEAGRMDCREIAGLDLVVNGHIHRQLHDVMTGRTRWMNPGSLTRISRSDASRQHAPGVLRVDVAPDGLDCRRVNVPHQAFEEVFHPTIESEAVVIQQSLFIRDLAKLQSVRTSAGVGLREFLDANLHQFEPEVADEINLLAEEVLSHGE